MRVCLFGKICVSSPLSGAEKHCFITTAPNLSNPHDVGGRFKAGSSRGELQFFYMMTLKYAYLMPPTQTRFQGRFADASTPGDTTECVPVYIWLVLPVLTN